MSPVRFRADSRNWSRNPPITLMTMITIAVQSITATAANSGASFRRRYLRISSSLYIGSPAGGSV